MVLKKRIAKSPHKKPLNRAQINRFRRTVYNEGHSNYRALPWRKNPTPYRVVVSELMLQQTQADRVSGHFREFLRRFSSWKRLAEAPLADVLAAWQGLGYNRRARALQQTAQIVRDTYRGRVPHNREELIVLPGIGHYTAEAVRAFAFNEPAVLVETNIREVFIRHFFPNAELVSDAELQAYVEAALDREHPRAWYTALMDYGAALKRSGSRASRRSSAYKKQSRFEGSARQLRGGIIRELSKRGALTTPKLARLLGRPEKEVRACISGLESEGLVARNGKQVVLGA